MECAKPCCKKVRTKICSGCLKEGYCSPDCQKEDWKIHKLMCAYMKNGQKLLAFTEVDAAIYKLMTQAKVRNGTEIEIRLLEFCLSFAEYQYGERIISKPYRERGDGSKIDNWRADVLSLNALCFSLGNTYSHLNDCIDNIEIRTDYNNKAVYFYQKSLSILEPWRIQADLEESQRIKYFNQDRIDYIYYRLSYTEFFLGESYSRLGNYDKAGDHCDTAISHGKRVSLEEEKTSIIYEALIRKGQNLQSQSKDREAKHVYEESYNLVVGFYYPDHPLVLKAANFLIDILITIEEYKDAERYARICYECLTRPVDTESVEVANAAEALSSATLSLILSNGLEIGDLVEAEMLARKSLRIKDAIYGSSHFVTLNTKANLSNILRLKKNHNDEAINLLEECLAIKIKRYGVDSIVVAEANEFLARFHYDIANELPDSDARMEHFLIAESYLNESIRIRTILSAAENQY